MDLLKHHIKGLDGKNHTTPILEKKVEKLDVKQIFTNQTTSTLKKENRESSSIKIVENTPDPKIKTILSDNNEFNSEIKYVPHSDFEIEYVPESDTEAENYFYSDYENESQFDSEHNGEHDGEHNGEHDGELNDFEHEMESDAETFSMTEKEKRQLRYYVKKLKLANDCMYPCLIRAYKIESCPKNLPKIKRAKCLQRRIEYIEMASPLCEDICSEQVFSKKERKQKKQNGNKTRKYEDKTMTRLREWKKQSKKPTFG
jgi:hypothetical protein